MKKTHDIFAEAISLPVDMRTQLVDTLLRSLHPIQKEIDELWAIEAEKRVQEIREGRATPVPGEDVFRKIGERFGSCNTHFILRPKRSYTRLLIITTNVRMVSAWNLLKKFTLSFKTFFHFLKHGLLFQQVRGDV